MYPIIRPASGARGERKARPNPEERYLYLVPKGRNEEGLSFTMSWVRHHDSYDNAAKEPGDLFEVK
jgi:predicted dithiol-disulfide oxidoreductase (DUF899 family)